MSLGIRRTFWPQCAPINLSSDLTDRGDTTQPSEVLRTFRRDLEQTEVHLEAFSLLPQ